MRGNVHLPRMNGKNYSCLNKGGIKVAQTTRSTIETFWENWVLNKIIRSIAVVIFLICISIAIIEVFRRYIFHVSFIWQQDIVTYGILSAVFLYFSITHYERGNIEVELFKDLLLKRSGIYHKLGRAMSLLSVVLNLVFVLILLYYSIPMVRHYKLQKIMVKSNLCQLWPFLLIFAVGMSMLVVTLIIQLFQKRGRNKVH